MQLYADNEYPNPKLPVTAFSIRRQYKDGGAVGGALRTKEVFKPNATYKKFLIKDEMPLLTRAPNRIKKEDQIAFLAAAVVRKHKLQNDYCKFSNFKSL